MKTTIFKAAVLAVVLSCGFYCGAKENVATTLKPSPDTVIQMLKDGNRRFVGGKAIHPHADAARLALAGREDQGKYAFATVLACSDSRVPVEVLFDAGVMDIFVVRVAGNVCNTDEIGSIEYGMAHVKTPVLVILGHTRCGAVTAVTEAVNGHGHKLERNIPALVGSIAPAVKKAMAEYPELRGGALVDKATEANIWQCVNNLFMKSPAVRELVKSGKYKVVGAIYDIGTGKIDWLPEAKVKAILDAVEKSPAKAVGVYAE